MTNIVKYSDIGSPYFPTYGKLCEIISNKSIGISKPYQKTLTFNLTLEGNAFISILDEINKNQNCFDDVLYAREDDSVFNALLFDGQLLLTAIYHKRPSHKYYRIGIESCTNILLEKFCKLLKDKLTPFEISYPTVDIRWYYKTSSGIDYNIFEEKAVQEINPLVYPYYDNIVQYVDDYINSNESVLILIGKPGTAKTSLIRYIISRYNQLMTNGDDDFDTANVYYTADQEVLSADTMFIHFASETKACMVMEDIDIHLSSRSDGNTFMYKLLGSSDGLIKNTSRKIIISTNLANVKDIDDALTRPGRCFGVKHHRELSYDEALALLNNIDTEKAKKFIDFDKKQTYSIADMFSNRLFRE